ncbi:hypothetical protein FOCC_FOCC004631 [Frankliniella occidentalis]|uniref:alpha-1,2-Mannosidase n=1 Tax=Frankliniella occidentalis TaxID=133901 RepID=A0A6J1TM81_FRAOC|nr:endoplasmic reticulum mannosyl-oligosaccharide 1,2-alpha-mannosidase [Frankliniella occidentalis]KAE8748620.1 hypothetical protein FOCC_FOCC004631 [Frankliniella occidentalis]
MSGFQSKREGYNFVPDFVELNVDHSLHDDSVDSFSVFRRRSVWRWWNQFSRFQKSLVYLLLVLVGLLYLYWLSTQYVRPNPYIDTQLSASQRQAPTEHQPISNEVVIDNKPHDSSKGDEAVLEDAAEGAAAPEEEAVGPPGGHLVNVGEQPGTVKPLDPLVKPIAMKFSGPSNERQEAVLNAFKHAWKGYKQYAWGHDNLKPISATYHDWFGLGLTIVDSLDTMYIMGLQDEFDEAKKWVSHSLRLNADRDVNLFEVTIRVLGGLLSAYHLSAERIFLEKAVELGDRLLPCFESDSGVPFSDVNLGSLKSHSPKWSPDSSTSEVTTVQLEFRDLSRITGDPKYEKAVSRVSEHIHRLPKTDGLVPIFINAHTGQFRTYSTITLGARGDSYYEYLLKQWLQTGQTVDYFRDDYLEAMRGVEKHLARHTPRKKYLFIGELMTGGKDFKPKMDHLTCYLPGTMALGVHYGLPQKHMDFASELLYTCYRTYKDQPTGLAAEITYFNLQDTGKDDMFVKTNDAHNLLRPETLESLYIMYQLTGNTTYQNWGWEIFQAFEKYTKTSVGYTSIGNVKSTQSPRPKDMMESFFLGETLKYLYLLFSDDRYLISLDQFVFNSEAHPLPIYDS